MRNVTVSILLASIAWDDAKEIVSNRAREAQDFMDSFVDDLVDKLFDRALQPGLKASSLHSAGLGSATLARPKHVVHVSPCSAYLEAMGGHGRPWQGMRSQRLPCEVVPGLRRSWEGVGGGGSIGRLPSSMGRERFRFVPHVMDKEKSEQAEQELLTHTPDDLAHSQHPAAPLEHLHLEDSLAHDQHHALRPPEGAPSLPKSHGSSIYKRMTQKASEDGELIIKSHGSSVVQNDIVQAKRVVKQLQMDAMSENRRVEEAEMVRKTAVAAGAAARAAAAAAKGVTPAALAAGAAAATDIEGVLTHVPGTKSTSRKGESELSKWAKRNFGAAGRAWLWRQSEIQSQAWEEKQIPIAFYRLWDLGELFGGALFLVLKKFKDVYGSVFLLPTGPTSSFLVLNDPENAKHVLNTYSKYQKGMVGELSKFMFGDGFVVADGEPWKIRRRAISPAFHKKYLDVMVKKVFVDCSLRTAEVLAANPPGQMVNMEQVFSELTLDIIGKAVFNYDFKAVMKGDPVIDAVYIALKECEARAIDFSPVWKLPGELPALISARQKKAFDAVALIRKTVEDLVEHCRVQLEAEEAAGNATKFNSEDYVAKTDPSILRFLIASREEVKSSQLRDDLLSMLVAGHETTAAVLTWTLYLLTKHPDVMARVQEEIDTNLGEKAQTGNVTMDDLFGLTYLRWCVAESMRLYPHPPVLIRRAIEDDVLPGGFKVGKGQDVMVSIYNIHHSESVWPRADNFEPERWSEYKKPRDNPNERNTNYHYIPFSGGARKCVGDQFALLETYAALASLLCKFDFKLVEDQKIGMTTGATIHTTNGMMMTFTPRNHHYAGPSKSTRQAEPLQKDPSSHLYDADAHGPKSSGCPFSQLR